jgi:hypothetical protein
MTSDFNDSNGVPEVSQNNDELQKLNADIWSVMV